MNIPWTLNNVIFVSALINFYRKKCSFLHWRTLHFRECDPLFKQALTALCLQELIAGPCPEPNESSSHTHPFFVWRSNINIRLSNLVTWCLFQYSYYVVTLTREAGALSLLQSICDPGVHPASHSVGTSGCFHRGEATEAWSWLLTTT
jgi:hypothetical protein